jgi:hypothetical protein
MPYVGPNSTWTPTTAGPTNNAFSSTASGYFQISYRVDITITLPPVAVAVAVFYNGSVIPYSVTTAGEKGSLALPTLNPSASFVYNYVSPGTLSVRIIANAPGATIGTSTLVPAFAEAAFNADATAILTIVELSPP